MRHEAWGMDSLTLLNGFVATDAGGLAAAIPQWSKGSTNMAQAPSFRQGPWRESGWCCPGARTRTFNLYRMADHSPDPNAKVKANNLLVGPFQPSPNAMRSGTATQLSGVECLGGGGDARALIAAMPQRAARLIVATKAGKLVACLLVTTRLPISFHFIVRVPSFG